MKQLAAASQHLDDVHWCSGRSSSEVITDRFDIRQIVDSLARHQCSGIASHDGCTVDVKIVGFGRDVEAVSWNVSGASNLSAPFAVELVGHNSIFKFRVEQSFQQPGAHSIWNPRQNSCLSSSLAAESAGKRGGSDTGPCWTCS